MIYQTVPVFIPITWNKRLLAASAVKRLNLEIATPAGQFIRLTVSVMPNVKIATVKTSVLTVGKIPSHYSRVYHTAGGAAFGSAGARYTRGNAVTVNFPRMIGEKIKPVDKIKKYSNN